MRDGGGEHVYDIARGRPSVGLVIKRRPGKPRALSGGVLKTKKNEIKLFLVV